ncbi:hypothetical protein GY45DRAFT_1374420 [Cubamyces sp. BRFM 1775]|nr:hypothetical protein GY45DRAFT_1374420 [Cubamyces sp. BRFM 1775]
MLFPSKHDSNVKTQRDLIVFCYAQERVLIPLPKTFEDAQSQAKSVFGIADDIEFETTDLYGSDGMRVRIHSTAWEGVSPVLHTVLVKAREAASEPNPSGRSAEILSNLPPRISAQKKVAASPNAAAPIRIQGMVGNPSGERQSASASKTPHKLPGSRTPLSTISSGSTTSKAPSQASSSRTAQRGKAPAPAPVPAPVKPVEASEGEEEEEEIRIVSPTKKRVNRPRILSDFGDEEREEDTAEDIDAAPPYDAHYSEEEYDELEETEYVSAAPPATKTSASAQGRSPAKFKAGSSSLRGNASLVQLDAVPSEREQSPKIKVEKAPAKPTKQSSQSQPEEVPTSQSQGRSDESFLIMIEYEKDPEGRSLFKTRGRHMVSKVLMQACRTFGIEQQYENARLVLLVEDEDDVYRSVCNRSDTMAQAGAEPNARFVVELVDQDDCEYTV